MPIALLVIGIIVVLAGVKNTASQVGAQIAGDFSGAGSFWYWIVAVLIIGGLGYYQPLKPVSHLFLLLIVLVFVLSNGGIYAQLVQAIQNPQPAPANPVPGSAPAPDPTGGAGWAIPPGFIPGFPGLINPLGQAQKAGNDALKNLPGSLQGLGGTLFGLGN